MQASVHDNFFGAFRVFTAKVSASADIPERSGVYSFFHAFDFPTSSISENLEKRIKSSVFHTLFTETPQRTKFEIDLRGKPSELSSKVIDFIVSGTCTAPFAKA